MVFDLKNADASRCCRIGGKIPALRHMVFAFPMADQLVNAEQYVFLKCIETQRHFLEYVVLDAFA